MARGRHSDRLGRLGDPANGLGAVRVAKTYRRGPPWCSPESIEQLDFQKLDLNQVWLTRVRLCCFLLRSSSFAKASAYAEASADKSEDGSSFGGHVAASALHVEDADSVHAERRVGAGCRPAPRGRVGIAIPPGWQAPRRSVIRSSLRLLSSTDEREQVPHARQGIARTSSQ
jgi:hypothetical protein